MQRLPGWPAGREKWERWRKRRRRKTDTTRWDAPSNGKTLTRTMLLATLNRVPGIPTKAEVARNSASVDCDVMSSFNDGIFAFLVTVNAYFCAEFWYKRTKWALRSYYGFRGAPFTDALLEKSCDMVKPGTSPSIGALSSSLVLSRNSASAACTLTAALQTLSNLYYNSFELHRASLLEASATVRIRRSASWYVRLEKLVSFNCSQKWPTDHTTARSTLRVLTTLYVLLFSFKTSSWQGDFFRLVIPGRVHNRFSCRKCRCRVSSRAHFSVTPALRGLLKVFQGHHHGTLLFLYEV